MDRRDDERLSRQVELGLLDMSETEPQGVDLRVPVGVDLDPAPRAQIVDRFLVLTGVEVDEPPGDRAVDLLRERLAEVEAPEAGLDMHDLRSSRLRHQRG